MKSLIKSFLTDESGATAAWTYADLQQAANRLSNALRALGIARGDRVALVLPQRAETIVAATPDIRGLVRDDWLRRHHIALVDSGRDRRRGEVDPVEALAAAKLGEARTLDEALAYLGPDEQAVTLATPHLFERLSLLSQGVDRPAA